MDRKSFLKSSALLLSGIFAPTSQASRLNLANDSESLKISEGPYITALSANSAVVVLMTNKLAVVKLTVSSKDDPKFAKEKIVYDSESTGRKHVGTLHKLTLRGLSNDKSYTYKIKVDEIKSYWSTEKGAKYGETKFGESIETSSITFSTLRTSDTDFSFFVMNDIHGVQARSSVFAKNSKGAEFLILNGDMLNSYENESQIFDKFLRPISEFAQGSVPIYYARGNHECRGQFAESFFNYFPTSTGKTYYSFITHNVFFLILDMCEDKPDDSRECGFITDFKRYRAEESAWLKQVVKSNAFKSAKRRIVVSHIPPFYKSGKSFNDEMNRYFGDILKNESIDLTISAHYHKHIYVKRGEKFSNSDILNTPLIINSNVELMKVEITQTQIGLKFFDVSSKQIKEIIV